MTNRDISYNIRRYRDDRNWTQGDLAKKLIDTGRVTVGAYETGARKPPRRVIIELASVFGISPQEIDPEFKDLTFSEEIYLKKLSSGVNNEVREESVPYGLSQDERELLELYRSVHGSKKEIIIGMIKGAVDYADQKTDNTAKTG